MELKIELPAHLKPQQTQSRLGDIFHRCFTNEYKSSHNSWQAFCIAIDSTRHLYSSPEKAVGAADLTSLLTARSKFMSSTGGKKERYALLTMRYSRQIKLQYPFAAAEIENYIKEIRQYIKDNPGI